MTSDELWEADGERFGWTLPKPAPRWKRLPIVRNFRAVWLSIQIERHYGFWGRLGMHRSGYDEWVLYAVMRGWC